MSLKKILSNCAELSTILPLWKQIEQKTKVKKKQSMAVREVRGDEKKWDEMGIIEIIKC
jgi:hypothetical protein